MISDNAAPDTSPASGVGRRHLLRGGALLAGAMGAAAVTAVASPTLAEAAAGDPLILGNTNDSGELATFLRIGGSDGNGSAALRLSNSYGPALSLEGSPRNAEASLQNGELAGSPFGIRIGTPDGTSWLATLFDLEQLPLPVGLEPQRLLDTRSPSGRGNIVATSNAGAINARGQLAARSWIDVGVWPADDPVVFESVFVNLTVTGGAGSGYLTAYPAATDRPGTSILNFGPGATVANGAFLLTGRSAGAFAVRIYVNQATAVIMDVTGAAVRANPDSVQARSERPANRAALSRKARQVRRLRKTLGHRVGR